MREIEEEIIQIVKENPQVTIEEIIEKCSPETRLDIKRITSTIQTLLANEFLVTKRIDDETYYYIGDLDKKQKTSVPQGRKPVISRKNGMVAACILAICLFFIAIVYLSGPVRYIFFFVGFLAVLLTGIFWILKS